MAAYKNSDLYARMVAEATESAAKLKKTKQLNEQVQQHIRRTLLTHMSLDLRTQFRV